MEVIDSLQVHQSEEVPTRKIAAFSYFYDRAVDAGMLQQGESAVVQVREMEVFLGISRVSKPCSFWVGLGTFSRSRLRIQRT